MELGVRTKFDGLVQLKQAIMRLDRAEEVVYDNGRQIDLRGTKGRFKALWNMDKNRVETIRGKDYILVQHKEVLEPFIQALSKLNLSVAGDIKDYGGAVYITCFFKNLELIKDDRSGIQRGIRIVNSFNSYTAIRGEMWGMRLVCSNGMRIPGFEAKVRQLHMGHINLPQLMEGFLTTVIEKSKSLKLLVSGAMADTLEWEIVQKVYKVLLKEEKHIEAIMKIFNEDNLDKKTITRWDVYNAITKYATHGKEKLLSVAVEDRLQKRAVRLLEQPIKVIMKPSK